jgi:hypothetical protein
MQIPYAYEHGQDGRLYRYKNLAGLPFGKWVVLKRVRHPIGRDKQLRNLWLCRCSCGIEKPLMYQSLVGGESTQCSDCYGKEQKVLPYSQVWNQVVAHAKDRRIEIKITREYAFGLLESQDYKCALTGISICIAGSRREHDVDRLTTASLDRVNSDVGYIKGNVWWVHKQVNIMKHKMTVARFAELCNLVAQRFAPEGYRREESDSEC